MKKNLLFPVTFGFSIVMFLNLSVVYASDTMVASEVSDVEELTVLGGFTDISDHWAKEYILTLYDLGVVSGKTPEIFAPDEYITRAEFTKIAVNALHNNPLINNSVAPFADVPVNSWASPYVAYAKSSGIISGYGDLFKPDNNISRAEALKVLIEAAGLDENSDTVILSYTDVFETDWFVQYVKYGLVKLIVDGYEDESFRPNNPITRAESAKIVVKVMELQQ